MHYQWYIIKVFKDLYKLCNLATGSFQLRALHFFELLCIFMFAFTNMSSLLVIVCPLRVKYLVSHTEPQNWRSLSDERRNVFKQDPSPVAFYLTHRDQDDLDDWEPSRTYHPRSFSSDSLCFIVTLPPWNVGVMVLVATCYPVEMRTYDWDHDQLLLSNSAKDGGASFYLSRIFGVFPHPLRGSNSRGCCYVQIVKPSEANCCWGVWWFGAKIKLDWLINDAYFWLW